MQLHIPIRGVIQRRSRSKKRVARLWLIVAAVFALGHGGQAGANAYAEQTLRDQLAALGFEDVELTVESVGLDAMLVRDVRLGPDLTIDAMKVGYAPDELYAGRIARLTLEGLHARLPLDAEGLRASALVRLLTSAPADPGSIPPIIVVDDAELSLDGETIAFDAELFPLRSGGRFELRSRLGRHTLEVTTATADGAMRVDLRAHGVEGQPTEGDALTARFTIPDGAGAPIEVVGALELGGLSAELGSHPLAAHGVHAELAATLVGSELMELELRAAVDGVAVDDVELASIAIVANRDAERVGWTASTAPNAATFVSLQGKLPADLSAWSASSRAGSSIAWRFEGLLPITAIDRQLADLAITGSASEISSEGVIHLGDGPPRAEGRLSASLGELGARGARLRAVHASLEGHGEGTAEGFAIELDEGSRITARAAAWDEASARQVVLAPRLRIVVDGESWRVSGGRVDARADSLTIGDGERRVVLEDARASLRSRDERPLATSGGVALWARVDARAARANGALEADRPRLLGRLGLERGPNGVNGHASLRLTAETAREPGSGLALADARLDLPLVVRAGGVTGDGRLAAARLSIGANALCAAQGRLRISRRAASFGLDCPLGGASPGNASRDSDLVAHLDVALGANTGTFDLEVPVHDLRPGAPLARVMEELTGLDIAGRAGGSMHGTLDAPERGRATLALEGATVRWDDSRAEGTRAIFDFSRLYPLTSAGATPVAWSSLTIEGFDVGGSGSARLRLEPSGTLDVEQLAIAALGGRVWLAPFAVVPGARDLSLRATVEGLDLGHLLDKATSGRAAGSGRLDGELALMVRRAHGREPGRIVLGPGLLTARGEGSFRFGDAAMLSTLGDWAGEGITGDLIARRLAGALADFDYRTLTIEVGAAAGESRVSAHVIGEGRSVPQEVDLTLRLNGMQQILDEMLRLGARHALGHRTEET